MANTTRVTELDFDTIKQNLKDFLKSQSQFTDYDFDASNLNVLMDILAYNTHYNAVLANMVSNEMFLDTALKRASVVSLAKQISYLPQSRRCATAKINIALQNVPSAPNFLTLNPYTLFSTTIDGSPYTFYNVDSYSTTPSNGVYTFEDVTLYQGRITEQYFTVSSAPSPAERYVIPNNNIDTHSIQVLVQYNGTSSFDEVYTAITDITTIDGNSKVYFIEENTQGYYEIFFGDDVLGKKLSPGDIVKIQYLITDGEAANVSNNISLQWTTNTIAGEGNNDRTITTISKPTGGAEKETIDSIRFRSTNNYSAQGRSITKTDYANIVSEYLPGVQSVNIWGGEDNVPPEYGKTFISVKPKTGYVLTTTEKDFIINEVLKPRSIITAQHEFVDPIYTYLTFNISVRYNSSRTNLSAGQIQTLVNDKVVEFMNANLSKFNAPFYRSQLEEQLMNLNDSIVSVNVLFSVQKRIPAIPGVRVEGVSGLQLPVKIHPNELRSSYFYYTDSNGVHVAQVRDVPDESPPDYEGTGVLKTFDLSTGAILDNSLATVDYGTGLITLNAASPLTVTGYLGNSSQFYYYVGVQESIGDIFPAFNEIIVLDDSTADTVSNVRNGITINVIAVNS